MSVTRDSLGYIAAALNKSGNDKTVGGVLADIIMGEAQLWQGREAAVVTNINDNDLNVWLYGGTLAEMPKLDASASAYARKLGLTRMTVTQARKGWERVLKPLGYERMGDMLIKEL